MIAHTPPAAWRLAAPELEPASLIVVTTGALAGYSAYRLAGGGAVGIGTALAVAPAAAFASLLTMLVITWRGI